MVCLVILRGIRLVIDVLRASPSRYIPEKGLVRVLWHLEQVPHWDIRTGPQGPDDKVVCHMRRLTVCICINRSHHVVRGSLLSDGLQC